MMERFRSRIDCPIPSRATPACILRTSLTQSSPVSFLLKGILRQFL
jgi:hypothetical protein